MTSIERQTAKQVSVLSEQEITEVISLARKYYYIHASTNKYDETVCFSTKNRRKYAQTFEKVEKLYTRELGAGVILKHGQEFETLRGVFDSSRLKDNEYVDEVIRYFVRSIEWLRNRLRS